MKPMIEGPTCARIRQLLVEPMTAFTIETLVGVCYPVARKNLKALHKAREVHIHAWWRGASVGPWTEVWALGTGDDARKPKPKPPAQRNVKRRKDPCVRMDELMAKRKKRLAFSNLRA